MNDKEFGLLAVDGARRAITTVATEGATWDAAGHGMCPGVWDEARLALWASMYGPSGRAMREATAAATDRCAGIPVGR